MRQIELMNQISSNSIGFQSRFNFADSRIFQAVALLKDGGRLVYAVESLCPEEGISLIARLLALFPSLQLAQPVRFFTSLEWSGQPKKGMAVEFLSLPNRAALSSFKLAKLRAQSKADVLA